MKKIYKNINRIGNSAGVMLDKVCLFASELNVGDKVEVKCSKKKITLIKVDEAEEK